MLTETSSLLESPFPLAPECIKISTRNLQESAKDGAQANKPSLCGAQGVKSRLPWATHTQQACPPKTKENGARELAWQLRALVLAEALGLTPSIHMPLQTSVTLIQGM